ncbi:GNAT family N-acetyltransferase [uncultured Methanobrevibacter sp.]|uniref:GNAT family N-acetyltransferase n=1 Tax=uncultured Methanobrevibacter sp. TaxID=253161 RepID=UPI0026DFA33E|nr:GNAT family N-acetyltransferase [uncultured Methanobrevibacter sp.]
MNTKYIKDHYQFQPLTVEHVLTDFECSSKDLTEFLRNDALTQQELYLNSTNLIMCKDKIIGFVSLLTDTFKIGNIQDEKLKKIIKKELNLIGNKNIVPAVKIGRFAIDKKYAGKGLGNHIFKNVLMNIINIKETVGFRYITIDAYASAFGFYVDKHGFEYYRNDEKNVKKIKEIIKKDPEKKFSLYIDLEKIKKLEENS